MFRNVSPLLATWQYWAPFPVLLSQMWLLSVRVRLFYRLHYEDVIRNCISIGGDSDTIAAIAGGIAEAFFGVPKEYADKAKSLGTTLV